MIAPASRKLGKYEIRHKLGRGGMADVYFAVDTQYNYQVALKIIEHAPDPDTRDTIEAERRGAELQAHLAAIDPRVCRVFDFGDAAGYFYVAMEYIDGQDLSDLMRRGPLAVGFATEVALAVARTLESAHGLRVKLGGKDFHGIVHGDIKPKNIRIDSRGQVRVLDFGIAKALSLTRRLTRNEFGSTAYASPERIENGDVNFGSDLWSLGVMLYEMLSGTQPYTGSGTEQLERRIRARVAPVPLPETCPEALHQIVAKALAPDPLRRYPSASDFASDLEASIQGRPVAAATLEDDVAEPEPDATRRTSPTDDVAKDDATRRTTRPTNAEPATVRTAPSGARHGASALSITVRAVLVLVSIVLLWGGWEIYSSYRLYEGGQELARQVEAEQLTDVEQIWAKWRELSGSNPSSLLLYSPRKKVKQRFLSAVDHVIETYRNGQQLVYERDWERARAIASHALMVDPEDSTRGLLRLCEGHLARINGTNRHNVTLLHTAIDKFTEAQHLLPHSPDPPLGLARVYMEGLGDVDKGAAALEEARKQGYQPGNRERAQLADAYHERAARLVRESRGVKGLPAEKDQLQRAADDFKHALEIYQDIAPYGNANRSILRTRTELDDVTFRLMQLDSGQ